MKLSEDEVLDARQALAEHTEALRPSNTLAATANQNRFDLQPSRTTIPPFDVERARKIRWEEIRLGRQLTSDELKKVG
jgi:hypothetical protein